MNGRCVGRNIFCIGYAQVDLLNLRDALVEFFAGVHGYERGTVIVVKITQIGRNIIFVQDANDGKGLAAQPHGVANCRV